MKIHKGVLIVIILIIFNLLFGGILIGIIASIKAPDISAQIDILELNQDEIILQVKIEIDNPNFFSLSVENFNIICMNQSNNIYGNLNITGGQIEGSSKANFIENGSFNFNNYDFGPLINKISGNIGFNFFGIINKAVPIKITLITDLQKILTNINTPEITINATISEVTEDGISFIGSINIFNPNKFKIIIQDMSLYLESDTGDNVGNINISSEEINPNSYKNFSINGDLLYKTLNYDKVLIELKAKAGARIAGFQKSINISSKTQFEIPDIKELLLINDTMDFSISGEFKLRMDGVLTKVGFKIYNPSEIPLHMNNLTCYISSSVENQTTVIVQKDMEECVIPSKNEVCIKTELTIPYLSLISSGGDKLFPEWFVITIKGNFFIEGTNQYIPISFNGYISPNFII
jgi:LEA14-like dessication related protein